VAYLADQDINERVELYVTDIDADPPTAVRINAELIPPGDVSWFGWSP
jgi:hypothetical protein